MKDKVKTKRKYVRHKEIKNLDYFEISDRRIKVEGIKKCPFCNGLADYHTGKYGWSSGMDGVWAWIECEKCGAKGPTRHEEYGSELPKALYDAVKDWNTRKYGRK